MKKSETKFVDRTTTKPSWIANASTAVEDAARNLRQNGRFFQGEPGMNLDGVIDEDEPRDSSTKNGTPVFLLQTIRLDNSHIQDMSVPKIIANLVKSLMEIGIAHEGHLKGVTIRTHWSKRVIPMQDGSTKNQVIMDNLTEIKQAPVQVIS